MPEGPEVRITTDGFRKTVKGKSLLSIDYSIESKFDTALSKFEFEELLPLKCIDVLCKGKTIFFWFEDDICIINNMMLTGSWVPLKGEHSHLKLSFGGTFDKPIKMSVVDTVLWFDDSTKYGKFEIVNWETAKRALGRIGPDFLQASVPYTKLDSTLNFFPTPMTLDLFKKRIEKVKGDINVSRFLTEQRNCSGIGNYLKSEILFKSRIKPDATLESLTEKQIEKLYKACVSLIKESYRKGGIITWSNLEGFYGNFVCTIYGQGKYNKHEVRVDNTIDGKKTYWVPKLQK